MAATVSSGLVLCSAVYCAIQSLDDLCSTPAQNGASAGCGLCAWAVAVAGGFAAGGGVCCALAVAHSIANAIATAEIPVRRCEFIYSLTFPQWRNESRRCRVPARGAAELRR